MDSNQIRERYLRFFEERGHSVIPSSPLVPENDPTTLFTGSGMQPMLPYLLGKKHPLGKRITDSQKSFRSGDIEKIGDNRHTTFFEMLGNWSLGDYFRKEQLTWIFEFLIDDLSLDPNRLYVTVFGGSEKNHLPRDEESPKIWSGLFKTKNIEAKIINIGDEKEGGKVGMQDGRIFYYDSKKNWWSRAGAPENMPAGEPGGPDSEMFYEFPQIEHNKDFGEYCHPNCDCGRFIEIGNSVFMEYIKQEDGSFELLENKNVDFGGGLERITMASMDTPDSFEANHRYILEKIENLSGVKYGSDTENTKAFRVIADHIKAAVFLIGDGVVPGNTDQGYVLRRLIRRVVRFADKLEIPKGRLGSIADTVIHAYYKVYEEIKFKHVDIVSTIEREENQFRVTLEKGLKQLEKITGDVSGEEAFILFSTYGFPVEMTEEFVSDKGYSVDTEGFYKETKSHQEKSRTASVGKFKGGLADSSEQTTKLHTAHHLLLAALQKVLGASVKQRGSNITGERLRVDFSFDRKLTDNEKIEIETKVNSWIEKDISITSKEMALSEAKKQGAEMEFGQKYPDVVTVYFIEDVDGNVISKEFCGGPHVENTAGLGSFKIIKEQASSAGVRRIKAVLE